MKSIIDTQHCLTRSLAHLRRSVQILHMHSSRHLPAGKQDRHFDIPTTIIRKSSPFFSLHRQKGAPGVRRGTAPDAVRIRTVPPGCHLLSFPCSQVVEPTSQVGARQPSSCISTWADKKRSGWREVILGDIPDLCPGHEVILILPLLSHRLLPLLDTQREQETLRANVPQVSKQLFSSVPGSVPGPSALHGHPDPAQPQRSVPVQGD